MGLKSGEISTANDSKQNRFSVLRKQIPDHLFFQPKLSVNRPDDIYEREADAAAEHVMQKPSNREQPVFFSPQPVVASPPVQAKCTACEEEEKLQREEGSAEDNFRGEQIECAQCEDDDAKSIQRKGRQQVNTSTNSLIENTLQSTGQSMDGATRGFMENRFGYDFSNVRIHNDSQAHQSASEINALAYTHKNQIAFASGQYQPHTYEGKKLLAHELTHVVQQSKSPRNIQRASDSDDENGSEEFIPTAPYTITISGITFSVPPEATYQPGKKIPQLLRIVLKSLLKDRYDEALVEPITKVLVDSKFIRVGDFASEDDSFKGELIGPIFLEIDPFLAITRELGKRNLTVTLPDEDIRKLEEAYYQYRLWEDFQKMSAREEMPLPKWYSKAFFDFQIQQDFFLLESYAFYHKTFAQHKDEASYNDVVESVESVFYALITPIDILDAIRKDISLSVNPETQLVYVSMWRMPDKPKKDKAKKDTSKTDPVPAYIQSFNTVTEFLKFASKETELFRDSETLPEARAALLRKFQLEGNFKPEEITVLPPFPSFIVAVDLNPDNTTITSAENTFRMITKFGALHGDDIGAVAIAMAMDTHYSWKVFSMPASLKAKRGESDTTPGALVEATNEFVKNSPDNLTDPVKAYDADDDYEFELEMDDVGVGEFVLTGIASPAYRKDLNWVQRPSMAGYPFFVYDADDLARMSAYADWDIIQSLKEQAKHADPEKKAELEKEIKRLEARENTDLLSLTKQDLSESRKLLASALKLQAFIEEDWKKQLSLKGDQATDPFIIRLMKHDPDLYNLFILVGQMFDLQIYGYKNAVEKFIEAVQQQVKDLEALHNRTEGAYQSFRSVDGETPTFRMVAALVKEDDGNLVPLLMVAGYHPEADPARGIHKIKLVDVTFEAPDKEEMIYVGDSVLDTSKEDELSDDELMRLRIRGVEEADSQEAAQEKAIKSAMVEFGGYNNYGEGKILYRIPGTSFAGEVDSITTAYEYLQMAIAALGLVVLVLGVVASAGTLTPAAAAVVTALGISVAVVGALMSAHNIGERSEKGTLKMDTEMALDIVNIVGAVVIGVGQVAKLTITASKMSQVAKVMQLMRLEKSLLLYDAADFSANVFLISAKVKEDIDAIEKLDVPDHVKEQMISAVTFDAIQQGAIMSVSARGVGKQAVDYYRTQVEIGPYKSLIERGWVDMDADGNLRITESAPPFLREAGSTPAATPGAGTTPRVEVEQEILPTIKSHDGNSSITLTEKGGIVVCTDSCQDIRIKYENEILQDPALHQRLDQIETKAREAANTKDEQLKTEAMTQARDLEADLATVVRRQSIKSYDDIVAPKGWKEAPRYKLLMEKFKNADVSPGFVQDILETAARNRKSKDFVATLYNVMVEHGKSPMTNFQKLLDGLVNRNGDIFSTAHVLLVRIENYRTGQNGIQQVDQILKRFSIDELTSIRLSHAGRYGDVEIINALTSIIGKTDESSTTIIDLIRKAASPSNPDKPDLLRLQNILEGLPPGQKFTAATIEEAIVRSNEFASGVETAMADPVHGFETLAKQIWGDNATIRDGNIEVDERFRKGGDDTSSAAYAQIIKVDDRGDALAASIVTGGKIDMARWEVIKKVINNSNIVTGIKNNAIGELWTRVNKLKLEAEGYTVVREVMLTVGKTEARADLVAIKDGELRVVECKAMGGDLSSAQKIIYPYLERGEFDAVKVKNDPSMDAMFKNPRITKSYELVRDTTP